MGKYEDLIERLRDVDEDLAEEFESFKGSSLRKQAERAPELESENAVLKARILELEEAPKREKAFREYGVNLDGLKPAEAELLKSLKLEGELTAEKVGEIVEKYQLPMLEQDSSEGEEESQASKIAKVASKAPLAPGASTITPEQAAKWPTDKWMRFEEAHPEEAEGLLRGERVTGVAFT